MQCAIPAQHFLSVTRGPNRTKYAPRYLLYFQGSERQNFIANSATRCCGRIQVFNSTTEGKHKLQSIAAEGQYHDLSSLSRLLDHIGRLLLHEFSHFRRR